MRRCLQKLRAWRTDRRGAVALVTALAAMALITVTAGAVDFGNVFLRTRQLQGMADLAALAAAHDLSHAQAAAEATAAANGWGRPVSTEVTTGLYRPLASLAIDQRFTAGTPATNAAEVTLRSSAELYFASVLLGRSALAISRKATAARAELASFSIGSRLLSLNAGLTNTILSGLTGGSVDLSVMDYGALASAHVDLFRYVQALKTRLDLKAGSFNQTLAGSLSTSDALAGIADVLELDGDGTAAKAMRTIAGAAGKDKIALGDMIDLGPYGDQDYLNPGGGSGVAVGALDLAAAALGIAQGGRQVKLDLTSAVPGLVQLTARLAIGERPANSPWIAITDRNDVVVRTAQARLFLDARILPAGGVLSGVASLEVPVVLELASAQAKLSSLDCGASPASSSVTLSVAPSIGEAAVAFPATNRLDDFSQPLPLADATLIDTLLIQVSGRADLALGGLSWQQVTFGGGEIAAGTVKTVKTDDLMQSLFSSLLGRLNLKVKLLGLGLALGQGPVTSAVQSTLSGVAKPLDGAIDGLTGLLGLGLGEADVRVNGLRCQAVALVR